MEELNKIMNTFDVLKRILRDKAICSKNAITIIDPPFEIEILRMEEMIIFKLGEEEVAVISRDSFEVKEEFEEYVKGWLKALTSLSFKRYIVKRRDDDNSGR